MQRSFSVLVPKPQRVDMYLSALFGEYSRSYIQKMIDRGHLLVNNQVIKKNLKLQKADTISLHLILQSSTLSAENIHLDILHEDINFCVINKDAGINVHPTPGIEGKTGTMVNALLYYFGNNLPVISGEERPGIVHRLDKDTSGAILVAKNDAAMHDISQKIKNREVKKYYIAIVTGLMPMQDFTIESDIGRHQTEKTKMTTQNPISPKYSITQGRVLGHIDDSYSLVRLDLITGRTHQIRVHLASIGYPIIGDGVYGKPEINDKVKKKYSLCRQALHAYEIEINILGKQYHFQAPLKKDLKAIIPTDLSAL